MNHPHGIWTSKNGRKQAIRDLADDHLLNILKLLYKPDTVAEIRTLLLEQAKKEDDRAVIDSGYMWDDMAGLAAAEHAEKLRGVADSPDLDVLLHRWPQLPHLEFEARRRGLTL